eukprot:SAG31_NODE_2019_length_6660_cov_2.597775_3_plen_144_part_00
MCAIRRRGRSKLLIDCVGATRSTEPSHGPARAVHPAAMAQHPIRIPSNQQDPCSRSYMWRRSSANASSPRAVAGPYTPFAHPDATLPAVRPSSARLLSTPRSRRSGRSSKTDHIALYRNPEDVVCRQHNLLESAACPCSPVRY